MAITFNVANRQPMNILFCLHHVGAFRSFDEVIRLLCHRGHGVTILFGEEDKQAVMDRAVQTCQAEVAGCDFGSLLVRQNWKGLANVRELVNCINYIRPGHPNPHMVKRFAPHIHDPFRKWMRKGLKKPVTAKLLASRKTRNLLKRLERMIPPDPTIVQWLEKHRPHVVVASPFIFPDSREVEYVKAAKHLNIPNIAVVLSWDNPTTKGTFHMIPDLTVTWNDALVEEVEALHDVPKNKTFVSGAPTFDFWFAMKPSSDFKDFAERVGIDPFKPFVLYLCSSNYIAANEHLFVSEFARTLKENPKTKDISVVVRPHPLNASIWQNRETPDLAVWPRTGEWVDLPQAKQDYYDTIFHSKAVVAVNTSAFLEAAILEKPCITVMTDDSKSKQAGLGHFQHLLNGGFLETATSYSEAATIVADIFSGRDSKKAQRQRFVREFIRPRGIHKPASQILAEVIEAVGSGVAPTTT
jgi:hypothetical protein